MAGEVVTAALFNTHLRDNLTHIGGTHGHGSGTAGEGTGDLGSLGIVTFVDSTADPGAVGTLQRNGTQLLYHNGSILTVLSPDAAAGSASMRSLGTAGTQAAGGNHEHSVTVAGSGTTVDATATVANNAVLENYGSFGSLGVTLTAIVIPTFTGTNRSLVMGGFAAAYRGGGGIQNATLELQLTSVSKATNVFTLGGTVGTSNDTRPGFAVVQFTEVNVASGATCTLRIDHNNGASTYSIIGRGLIQTILRTPPA